MARLAVTIHSDPLRKKEWNLKDSEQHTPAQRRRGGVPRDRVKLPKYKLERNWQLCLASISRRMWWKHWGWLRLAARNCKWDQFCWPKEMEPWRELRRQERFFCLWNQKSCLKKDWSPPNHQKSGQRLIILRSSCRVWWKHKTNERY